MSKSTKVTEHEFLFSDNSKSHNALSFYILEAYRKAAKQDYSNGQYMTITKKMGSNCLVGKNGYTAQTLNALIGVNDKTAKLVALRLWADMDAVIASNGLYGKANNDVSKASRLLAGVIGNKTIDGRDAVTVKLTMQVIDKIVNDFTQQSEQLILENKG